MAPYTLPKNAVWFITGCSSGIGYSLAEYLITKTPSRVVATARKPSTLSSLPDGPNILKLALDVTSEASIQAALSATLDKFSRIDVLVNNAGYGTFGDTETADLASARNVMDTNFWGAVRLSQLALPVMRDTNKASGTQGGLIMQVTSMGGRVAVAGNSFYHASKFALEGFTESLAKEMAPDWNIKFLIVEPGGVKTKYADTTLTSFTSETRLDVYKDPALPINQLLNYLETPGANANWAEPEKLAEVLYAYVEKGGEMQLRLPLGSDAWTFQKVAYESWLKELENVKEVSCSTSTEEQVKSVEFLTKGL